MAKDTIKTVPETRHDEDIEVRLTPISMAFATRKTDVYASI